MNCTTALFVFFALKRSCEKLSFYILKCESIASNFLWNPSDEGGFNLIRRKKYCRGTGGGGYAIMLCTVSRPLPNLVPTNC